MQARKWAIFIGVNVIVSALVMLTVLFVWQRLQSPTPSAPTVAVTLTPVSTFSAPEATASDPTAPPAAPASTPESQTYTVQEGDTLGAIAQAHDVSIENLMTANGLTDPNVLQVGQRLIIPVSPPSNSTPEPSGETVPETATAVVSAPAPLPTLTTSGPPVVEIGQVLGSGDLAAEVVLVRNRGGGVTLEGWTLSDSGGSTFAFPAITLFPDAQVRLHSAAGASTPTDLYWGRATPAWTGGILITLRDAEGNVVDTYIVP